MLTLDQAFDDLEFVIETQTRFHATLLDNIAIAINLGHPNDGAPVRITNQGIAGHYFSLAIGANSHYRPDRHAGRQLSRGIVDLRARPESARIRIAHWNDLRHARGKCLIRQSIQFECNWRPCFNALEILLGYAQIQLQAIGGNQQQHV